MENFLTAKERLQIRQWHSSGCTSEEIAEKTKLSVKDIDIELTAKGLRPNVKEDVPPSEFATKQYISEDKPKRAQSVWTPELDAELYGLYNLGKSVSEISAQLKIPANIIRPKLSWAKKKGLISAQQPKAPAMTVKPDFEKAVAEMDSAVTNNTKNAVKIPKNVIELVKFELETVKEEFVEIDKDYQQYKGVIEDYENFLKECENDVKI